jgi:glycosyltransferase involved in cell wall biosynthesis
MKVIFYPNQPHCFAYGGFEIQMNSAFESLLKFDIIIKKMDIWSRDKDFDIIHIWGLSRSNYEIIDWAKKCNKVIVASLLLPYHDTFRSKIGHVYRKYFSKNFKEYKSYLNKIDQISVVNEMQAKVLAKIYSVSGSKINIIPNIVHDKYFKNNLRSESFSDMFNSKDYVLSVGNICRRKNQLNLVKACINLNLNLVLIGNSLDGENDYSEKIKSLIETNNNIKWFCELPYASNELFSAFSGCILYALPSESETQPISVLEAIAMKKKILLSNKIYAFDPLFEGVVRSKTNSVKDIENALRISLSNNKNYNNNIINECTIDSVGYKYFEFYQRSLH